MGRVDKRVIRACGLFRLAYPGDLKLIRQLMCIPISRIER